MTLVTLPPSPGPRSIAPELVDFGGTQQGPLGGAAQRVNRLGNRWQMTVVMPPMAPDLAGIWAGALTRGLRFGVSWAIRQTGMNIGTPGSPRVFGAGQAGGALPIDGLTPGYEVGGGRWLNVITAGQRYLYLSAETVSAGASGRATLEIEPWLRVAPGDDDVVELAEPRIDGLLEVPHAWAIDRNRLCNGFEFTIVEAL